MKQKYNNNKIGMNGMTVAKQRKKNIATTEEHTFNIGISLQFRPNELHIAKMYQVL